MLFTFLAIQEIFSFSVVAINSSKQDTGFAYKISLLHPAQNNFIDITPLSIAVFFFHGIHEQFHMGYCAWNVSLLHPPCKDFIGIIPSLILAFLDFILVSIFHFHGSHE